MSATPPTGYATIIADCPWRYGGSNQFQDGARRSPIAGKITEQYPTMTTDALAALPVAACCADRAVLLLWATWPCLPDALAVMQGWGFTYVTGFPWIKLDGDPARTLTGEWAYKPQYGIGFWVRGCSELLLIGRRGDVSLRSPFIGLLSENFGHSRKPDNLYEYAAQFPGPYLELFARRPRAGWTTLGNALDGQDIRDALTALAGAGARAPEE